MGMGLGWGKGVHRAQTTLVCDNVDVLCCECVIELLQRTLHGEGRG